MIADPRIDIDFEDTIALDSSSEIILAVPRLIPALKILIAPGLWVGESFVRGQWYLKKGRLTDFLEIILRNPPKKYGWLYSWMQTVKGLRYYSRQYVFNRYFTRKVRNHYDIDSHIYEMLLDDEMVYTCGFFDTAHDTLDKAQANKLRMTFERMHLSAEAPAILDIGCGWGAMERFIVRNHPSATVHGLSISGSQIEWARERDAVALSEVERERVAYFLRDYRLHTQLDCYDAICVIGMIEHVGLGGYGEFFDQLVKFLKPKGTVLLHSIIAPASGIPIHRWFDRHIFTGGYAPSLSDLLLAVESTPFRIEAIHIHPPANYRRTIEGWLINFSAQARRMASYLETQGASPEAAERAIRTWDFYLSGARNMFTHARAEAYQVAQLCMRKL